MWYTNINKFTVLQVALMVLSLCVNFYWTFWYTVVHHSLELISCILLNDNNAYSTKISAVLSYLTEETIPLE